MSKDRERSLCEKGPKKPKRSFPQVRQQVTAGIAALDRYHSGWRSVVDMKLLDCSSVTQCLLGQLFRDHPGCPYLTGIACLRTLDPGFSAYSCGFGAADQEECAAMDDMWRMLA